MAGEKGADVADRDEDVLAKIRAGQLYTESEVLLPPFHAGFGSNVHIGDDFFGNVNLTFVDDVEIRIGHGVMIAPGVTLTTTGHPIHPDLREIVPGHSARCWVAQELTATEAAGVQ